MTIAADAQSVTVLGNGAQTVFSYSFLIPDKTTADLYLLDALGIGTLVAPALWTMTGAGLSSGGTFTYPISGTPIAAGTSLTLVRRVPRTQTTGFNNQTAYYPAALENALDKIELQVQDLAATAGRSLVVPPYEPAMAPLPAAAVRGNRLLGFDSTGQPALLPQSLVATTSPPSTAYNWVHVDAFGAKGDGTTDDTAAFQAAHNQLAATGGVVWLSPKPYRIAGTVNVTASVIFQGQGCELIHPARGSGNLSCPAGSYALHANLAGPAFYLSGSSATGAGFRDLGFFEPGHPVPATGWAPTAYGPCVAGRNIDDMAFAGHVHFHNINKWLDADYCARIRIDYLSGQTFTYGLMINHAYDIGVCSHVRFWTYWSEADGVLLYAQANADGIVTGTPDCCFFDAIFGITLRRLFYAQASDGFPHTVWINQIYGDFVTTVVQLDGFQTIGHIGKIFHLGQQWPPAANTAAVGGAALKISNTKAAVHIDSVWSTMAWRAAVVLTGTANSCFIGQITGDRWNQANDGSPLLDAGADAGNTLHIGSQPAFFPGSGGNYYSSGGGRTMSNVTQYNGITAGANPINFVQANSGGPGAPASIYVAGEANASLLVAAQGSGDVQIGSPSGRVDLRGPAVGTAGGLAGYLALKINGTDLRIPFYAP